MRTQHTHKRISKLFLHTHIVKFLLWKFYQYFPSTLQYIFFLNNLPKRMHLHFYIQNKTPTYEKMTKMQAHALR